MKKLFTLVLMLTLLIGTEANGISPYCFYKKLVKKESIATVREYNTEDLTYDILANRNGDIIIEKMIGTVVDKKGNGKLYGMGKYNYISYKGVKGIRKGDVVLTVVIYNPANNYEDDIVERFDYIIDRKGGKK